MTEDCGIGHSRCHDDSCGGCCGHGGGCSPQTVRLTLEDGKDVDCAIVGIFDIDEKEYIALLPEGSDGVMIYGYKELEGGEVELSRIDDDAEYDEVGEVFLKLYEEESENYGD